MSDILGFKNFFDTAPFMMGIVEIRRDDIYFVSANSSSAQFFGTSPEVMQNHCAKELGIPGRVSNLWITHLKQVDKTGSPDFFEYKSSEEDHSNWLAVTMAPIPSHSGKHRYSYLIQNISENKRIEKAQQVIYRISQATVTTKTLSELYSSIHAILEELMPVDNFYIALYDHEHDLLSFPYFIDQFDAPPEPQKSGHGLTEYVLRTGQSLLASEEVFGQLRQQGDVELVGSDSLAWLGVPLKGEVGVIGVMVAQSYTEGIQYAQQDLEIFEFVSTQIGQAIERKSAEEQIYKNAIQAKALAEISAVIGKVSLEYHTVLEEVAIQVARLLGDVSIIFLKNGDDNRLHAVKIHSPYLEIKSTIADLYSIASARIDEWITDRLGVRKSTVKLSNISLLRIQQVITSYHQPDSKGFIISNILAVPMQSRQQIMGALCVLRGQGGNPYTNTDQSFLQEIAERTAMAITNAILYRQEQERSRELLLLNSLSASLRKYFTIDEMLPPILSEIQHLFRADAGLIALKNPGSAHYRIIGANGSLITNTNRLVILRDGKCKTYLQNQQPFVSPDYASEPNRWTDLFGDELLGPSVLVPLQSEVGPLGILMISKLKAPRLASFTNKEVELLLTVGELLGNSIRRAILFEDSQRRLRHTQCLHMIDTAISSNFDLHSTLDVFLDQVISELSVDAACVLMLARPSMVLEFAEGKGFSTQALQFTHLQIGQGYAGIAASEGRIVSIPNLQSRKTDFLRSPYFGAEGFITYYAIPLRAKSQITGVLEIYQRHEFTPDAEWLDFAQTLAGQAAIAIENATLISNLEKTNRELSEAYEATIEGWSFALDLRDRETEGHTRRVTELSLKIAEAFGLPDDDLVHLKRGALLHDIGKMGIPDPILLKPGPLTEDEWKIMRKHPEYAREMLASISYLSQATDIPYCHHEKWDGTGYPRQLRGEQIPLMARIFAVVDVWDALRSDRPYRPAWTEERALAYIKDQSGKHFDPKVVEVFLTMIHPGKRNSFF